LKKVTLKEIIYKQQKKCWLMKTNIDTDKLLIADAPLLLEEVKHLTKTLELIGKNMEYDPWMHTLIKDVIGYEKWQAKEMIE